MISPKSLKVVLVILIVMALIGCGRKRPPRVPELFAPAQVKLFKAVGTVEGVTLQWQVPDVQADGKALEDLNRFEIYRSVYSDDEDVDFDRLAIVTYSGPKRVVDIDDEPKEEEVEEKDSGFVAFGAKMKKSKSEVEIINYTDKTTEPGSRYLYYIEPYGDGRVGGAPSATLLVTFVGESSQVELFVR